MGYPLWMDSPYVPLSKSDEKLSAEKNNTGGARAPALSGQDGYLEGTLQNCLRFFDNFPQPVCNKCQTVKTDRKTDLTDSITSHADVTRGVTMSYQHVNGKAHTKIFNDNVNMMLG